MQRGRAQHIVVVFVVDLRVSAFAGFIMIQARESHETIARHHAELRARAARAVRDPVITGHRAIRFTWSGHSGPGDTRRAGMYVQ